MRNQNFTACSVLGVAGNSSVGETRLATVCLPAGGPPAIVRCFRGWGGTLEIKGPTSGASYPSNHHPHFVFDFSMMTITLSR